VLEILEQSLRFMKRGERLRFYLFLFLRALVAFLDLIGILAIGLLATSAALFISAGSDTARFIEVGSLKFPATNLQNLPVLVTIILVLFIAKAILSVTFTHQLAKFLAKIEARAARLIAKNVFGKGIESARKSSREEILFAVQVGSPTVFNSILNSVGTLVAEGFLFMLVLVAFFLVNPAVAIGALIYFGAIGVLIQFFIGKMLERTGFKLANSTVQANTSISDLSEVLREASILGSQDYFYAKIFESRLQASSSAATQYVLSGAPRYIVENALLIAIALFVVTQALTGEITSSAATIGIFLSGGLRLTSSLLPLQSAFLIIKQSIPAATRALKYLPKSEKEADQRHKGSGLTSDKPVGVKISQLSYKYPDSKTETLRNVSLEIPAGSQAAFIGHSGAGKSTLADLILGLVKPESGSVRVGGEDPFTVIETSPGVMGYVPQVPGMVSGTIAENIALGVAAEDIDSDRLNRAISDAHLGDLIASLPLGIGTDLGKRKDELSGGQLQRIGLARALYPQPKLLVMDEATSALDADSENEINKALDEMRGEVTVILIAHRLNTVQRSDIVFLLENGCVSASGTFSELRRTNETVRHLSDLMTIGTDDVPDESGTRSK